MEFSRQEYRSVLPFPSPEDLSDPGIKFLSLAFPPLAGEFFTTTLAGKSAQISFGKGCLSMNLFFWGQIY